jgi:hypothetical protein
MEIESALVAHPRVAEAAVVGKPHEIKGEAVFAYVVTRGPRPTGDTGALVKELRDWVGQQLGPIAKPDEIRFADNLPKTRSGKIMRRLLKAIARGEEITQDVSTLENPAILEQLRGDTGGTQREAAPLGKPAPAAAAKPAARPAARRSAARSVKPRRRPAAGPKRRGATKKRSVSRSARRSKAPGVGSPRRASGTRRRARRR